MAIHLNANSLTAEVIEEYLDIAKVCIVTKKQDGGIYGYPATLLLFCVINALGESLRKDNEPFQVLTQPPFNCNLSRDQIKKLEMWYRNLLAHNGMIAPGACLSPDECGDAFVFVATEPIEIRVKPLYDLVRAAWDQVNTAMLNSSWRHHTNPEIQNPILLAGATPLVPVTASGSNYVAPPGAISGRKKSQTRTK
jgi:hypothetical protein